MMKYDAVVVGAGPAGLSCARILAENGVSVLVLERNDVVGPKVCAGGITAGRFLETLPAHLIEHQFVRQDIVTSRQRVTLEAPRPIIATIDRVGLGTHLAALAAEVGATIMTGTRVERIADDTVYFRRGAGRGSVRWDHLVGSDGSASIVRRWLAIDRGRPHRGLAAHYRLDAGDRGMAWHFAPRLLRSGYAWIFPHRDYLSAGIYAGYRPVSARALKKHLDSWLLMNSLPRPAARIEAAPICYDYRGWAFGRVFLTGEAAGLASPLTGEGINPAVLSGQAAARTIIDRRYSSTELDTVITRHRRHRLALRLAGRSRWRAALLIELSAFLLKHRLVPIDVFALA